MLWLDFSKHKPFRSHHKLTGGGLGFSGGFSSMIGNAAGPIITLYFLSMRLPKNEFIGTGAWFYLIMNVMKVPFHVFVWKTINLNTLILNILVAPVILFGAFIGIHVVKLIPEKIYRVFIIISTIFAVIFLF
jgi:uncharacterized membrane protein YfcA